MNDPIPPGHGEPEPVDHIVRHRGGPAWRPAPDRSEVQLAFDAGERETGDTRYSDPAFVAKVEELEHDDWPVHEPECFDAPIPGRQWYGGCEPGGDWDSELGRYTGTGPRVNPATGVCEGCGASACRECGRENCPDHEASTERKT